MYRIIDGHAHIYPEKIAAKAAESIVAFYGLNVLEQRFDGTVKSLLALGDKNGVSRFLVHSVATSAHQVGSINSFIAGQCRIEPRLIGFCTLHPDFENPGDELVRARDMGLMGVKLHPDFQQFDIDDPRMDAAYEAMQALGLPVLLHMGDVRYDWSSPRHIPALRRKFPHLKIICAHFGGYMHWEEAAEYLKGQNVFVDSSSSLFAFTDDQARHYIRHFGTDRVIFGSDYPMWNMEDDIRRIISLDLGEEVTQQIFAGNLEALLGLRA